MLQKLARFFTAFQSNGKLIRELLMDLLRFHPLRLGTTFFFMLFRNMTAGASLFLILPLLQLIGLSEKQSGGRGITSYVDSLYGFLQVPMTLSTILVGYSLVVSFVALTGFFEQIMSAKLQQQYIHQLREKLYQHVLQASWCFLIKQKIPSLIHSLTAQIQAVSATNIQLLQLINQVILIVVYVTLALFVSWKMTLIAGCCALLLMTSLLPLHKLTAQSGQLHVTNNKKILQLITEQLSALKMIKGSGFEKRFIQETMSISRSMEKQNQHLTFYTALTNLVFSMGAVLCFSLLFWLTVVVLKTQVALLLLLLIIFSRVLPTVSRIQQIYQRILYHLPAFCDVKQLLQTALLHQENLQEPSLAFRFNEVITLRQVSFRYPAQQPFIIHNLSVQIKKNTIVSIVGPSGVGKTTLADLIIGLLPPTSGTIHVGNVRLTSSNLLAWRGKVAYVTQDPFLFNASIRDNLQLFCGHCPDAALWEVLHLVAADDFVANLNQGLDTILGDRGVRLSGGERQRLALARAWLTKPELLVLDESTNALDKQNIQHIQQALTNLRGKITIIIISHQAEMSGFADQQIRLTSIKPMRLSWPAI